MSIADTVAANLARLRAERGVSLSELARRSRLAKATLSKLELGQTNATIETLGAIAQVLDVPVTSFFAERGVAVQVQRRADAGWIRGGGIEGRALTTVYGSGLIECYELRLFREPREAAPHPPGTLEYVFVLAGRVRVGPIAATEDLRRGDYMRFSGDQPHVYQALTDTANVHLMMSVPQPQAAGPVGLPNGDE